MMSITSSIPIRYSTVYIPIFFLYTDKKALLF